jgi:hypothetical protein
MKAIRFPILIFSFISLVFICSLPLEAQIGKNGGSTYSIFGIGDLNYSASTRTDGMGIMGFSLLGNYTNTMNPAAWTEIPFTKFSTEFNFQKTNSTDGLNTSNRTYSDFESFNLSIPVNQKHGLILNLGMDNYSKVNYDIKLRSTALDENYTLYYSGVGGLTRINLGLSYIIFKYCSIGAQFNYSFGNIQKTFQIIFDNPVLFNTHNENSNTISGFYFNSGLIFHGFGDLFKSKKLNNLNLGIYYSTPAKLSSSLSAIYERSTNADSTELSSGDINMPWSLGFGLSNTFYNSLVVAADVLFQNWNQYKYYGSHPDIIKNSIRTGVGAEYTPSTKLEDPWYKKMSYRIGGSYTVGYLRINGQSINEIAINAGFTLPLSRLNNADFLISYLTRGTTTDGLVQDKILKLGVSINIGELWFLKHKGD